MTIDCRILMPLLLAVAACDMSPPVNGQENVSNLRVNITARYDPELLGRAVHLQIRNGESFPICFSSSDLELVEGSTLVRNAQGTILNGHGSGALEDLRGINVAQPVEVLRPGKEHSEFIDLEEFSPDRQLLVLQVRLHAFRCSDLFDVAVQEVRSTMIEKPFRIANGRILEQPGLRFPDNGSSR